MTKEEHQLMILMFARLHEALEAISETLSSRGIWAGDDKCGFRGKAGAIPKLIRSAFRN